MIGRNETKNKFGGGMFGINDNDSATDNSGVTDPPAIIHDNLPSSSSSPAPQTSPSALPTVTDSDTPQTAGDDLLDLKHEALQSLQPLVGHLDQTPEEKFKTTMMLIQATDNSSLVKEAYEAANQITDEKTRAQALLDIVNEINYFTQHQEDKP
jgi:hypothetical protein